MAYMVGTTIVIDDTGFVDWSRITNKPAIGSGDVTGVSVSNTTPTSGQSLGTLLHSRTSNACTSNCYIASLSGGGSSGAVTITANRQFFNCNCACRC